MFTGGTTTGKLELYFSMFSDGESSMSFTGKNLSQQHLTVLPVSVRVPSLSQIFCLSVSLDENILYCTLLNG